MATKFSLKDPNPGVWFKFNDEDPESGEICIRPVNAEKRAEIQKRTVKRKVEYKHGQRFEYVETDDDKFSEMLWDYVISDWTRLEDDDGKPIQCNTENKLFLMMNNVGFSQFVAVCTEKVNKGIEERFKATEKNSLSGSSDSLRSRPAKSAKN